MSRDAPWFYHDSDALSDEKSIALTRHHGAAGYGTWWAVCEMLRRAEGYRIELTDRGINATALLLAMQPAELRAMIQDMASDEIGLLRTDGTWYWSESMNRRMEKYGAVKAARVMAGKTGARVRWQTHSKRIANACDTNAIAIAKHSDRLIDREEGRNGSVNGSQLPHSILLTDGQEEKKPIKIRPGWKQCPAGHWYNGRYCIDCACIAKQAELDAKRAKKVEAAD